MSIRAELEELAKWISDLSADAPAPATKPVPRATWQKIREQLETVAARLAEAQVALERVAGQDAGLTGFGAGRRRERRKLAVSVVVELAADLHRQAAALSLRADRLFWRAAPPTAAEEAEMERAEAAARKERAEAARKRRDEEAAQGERDADERKRKKDPVPKSAAELAGSAGDAIEKVHRKIAEVGPPDAVAKAFDEELDVLGEMVLSLRERCAGLEGVAR